MSDAAEPQNRGQFRPGRSGNPGGRPKGGNPAVALARKHTAKAVAKLANLMASAADERTQCAAAQALLDRGWGKPTQSLEHSGKDGGPLEFTVREV